ncbi:PREDICTED: defensin-5-like [Chinchilla lanigera]|uniref:Defensin-5-like n=1 Tax=Chinchilla lanigera TaxID=34839 RepID=A0A8C2YSK3_CHILA|nr:PREDICTED: defensin-5-like [Chinchilla lanigera]
MRTLALLAAIFLLAPLAQAEPLQEKAENAQEEQQPEEQGQDVAISLGGASRSNLQDAGRALLKTCYCRRLFCGFLERRSGTCILNGKSYLFCCR